MKKLIKIFLTSLCLINLCKVVPANDDPNIYQITKNATIKHPDSTSKHEHGKLDVLHLREIFTSILNLISLLLSPLKLGIKGAVDVAEIIIPEGKGLDTNHSFCNGVLEDFKKKVGLIAPGTKWCGAGNIAHNESDVGVLAGTDSCCRSHDLCPVSIAADETKYGLKNDGLFTRSSCDCDEEFYNCLKKVGSKPSDSTGKTYFNVLGPQCFKMVNCSDPGVKCRKHQKEGTQYQWSDNPKY